MPVCFSFTDKKTGDVVPLNTVDRAMCEYSKVEYSDKDYCPLFQVANIYGISACKDGGITLDKLNAVIVRANLADDVAAGLRKFLIEDYTFDSWWTSGHRG